MYYWQGYVHFVSIALEMGEGNSEIHKKINIKLYTYLMWFLACRNLEI